MKAFLVSLLVITLLVTTTACSSASTPPPLQPTSTPIPPTNTPIPPTATLTPIPTTPLPTSKPTEAFRLASSAEEVIGTWYNPQIICLRFKEDGTLDHAGSPNSLDKPIAIDEYWFDNTKLHFQTFFVSGVPKCEPIAFTRSGYLRVEISNSKQLTINAAQEKVTQKVFTSRFNRLRKIAYRQETAQHRLLTVSKIPVAGTGSRYPFWTHTCHLWVTSPTLP